MRSTHHLWETAAIALPFLCVGVGLYLFRSAWMAMLTYHAGIVVLLALRGGGDVSRLVRSGWSRGWFLVAGVPCLLAGAIVFALWSEMSIPFTSLADRLDGVGLGSSERVWFLAWFALVHPTLEELHWRGSLLVAGASPASRDIAFAAYHVPVLLLFIKPLWVGVAFVTLAAAAFLWRRIALRTGGLAVAVLSHTLADIGVAIAVLALIR